MLRISLAATVAVALAASAAGAQTQPPMSAAPPAPPPADAQPNDYASPVNWLCWPGRKDACESDLTTTVIKPDGTTSIEAFRADPNAKIDCFYVYPTVSHDPGMVSDMTVKPEETNVVIQQAARLTAHCRLYAPMYRQFTLTALFYFATHPPAPGGTPPAPRPQLGYNDVKDAWNYYLAHENHGRGVVLVGHSQGSGVLTQLIKNEIDGKPEQARIVSAILMGTVLPVPEGQGVGGAFQHIPLCQSASQTGCAIAYSSFRQTSLPPPDNSRFGRVRGPNAAGMQAACVNPAHLGPSTASGPAHAYFGAAIANADADAFPWLKGTPITTPFVSVPGMLTAQCVATGPYNVLAISIADAPAGSPRSNLIPGDVVVMGQLQKDWGLHLIDANLFQGNLVDIVGAESDAWLKAHP